MASIELNMLHARIRELRETSAAPQKVFAGGLDATCMQDAWRLRVAEHPRHGQHSEELMAMSTEVLDISKLRTDLKEHASSTGTTGGTLQPQRHAADVKADEVAIAASLLPNAAVGS